jgi:hypothetical protein
VKFYTYIRILGPKFSVLLHFYDEIVMYTTAQAMKSPNVPFPEHSFPSFFESAQTYPYSSNKEAAKQGANRILITVEH